MRRFGCVALLCMESGKGALDREMLVLVHVHVEKVCTSMSTSYSYLRKLKSILFTGTIIRRKSRSTSFHTKI
jgi:hypothetical protein